MASIMDATNAEDGAVDEWEKEDPNLLNNPELLFRECEKLPAPKSVCSEDEELYWQSAKLIREILLNHNFILDRLSQRVEFHGNRDHARQVLETLVTSFEADNLKSLNTWVEKFQTPVWEAAIKSKVFSLQSTERVQQWRHALHLFLESYLKIRSYVSKETEDNEEHQEMDDEKEMWNHLPVIVEELEEFIKSLKENESCKL